MAARDQRRREQARGLRAVTAAVSECEGELRQHLVPADEAAATRKTEDLPAQRSRCRSSRRSTANSALAERRGAVGARVADAKLSHRSLPPDRSPVIVWDK